VFALAVAHATGNPVLDAQADFRRARRAHGAARIGRWVARRGRRSRPSTLTEVTAKVGGIPHLEVVPLCSIVGTLEPTSQFDARFRPSSELIRHRWERIALAHRRGDALPPIVLLARPEGYYVVDGRHRVSVALALGQRSIDSLVTGRCEHSRPRRAGSSRHLGVLSPQTC
jgi:hypothetical protein